MKAPADEAAQAQEAEQKRAHIQGWLERCAGLRARGASVVAVIIDGAVEGVMVPQHLLGQRFALNLSLRYGTPLELHATGIYATLSFSGRDYNCFLPWRSVVGATAGGLDASTVWPSDRDLPIAEPKTLAAAEAQIAVEQPKPSKPRPSFLRLVPDLPTEE